MTNYSRSVLLSNGLHHSENLPVKFGFSPKIVPANIVQKLPSQRCSKPLFIAFFNFSHKRPTFAFTGESGYTLGSRRKIAHSGTHGETGAFRTGPLSLPSTRTARSRTSPGRVPERRTLPLWDLAREVLSKNAESLRDSDALMRVAVPRRRGPAGLRDLFRFCRNCGLYALRSGPFRVCEARGGITLEMSRNVQSGNTQNLKSSAASDQAAVCACARSRYFAGGSPSGLRV